VAVYPDEPAGHEIRGVFNVEVFECPLDRIQNTELRFSVLERLTASARFISKLRARAGFAAARAAWRMAARPLEVHEKLARPFTAQNRGQHGL
jgi:hypothetical protein